MKIALIGATGFVGSRVMARLLARRHEVTAIVRRAEAVKSAPGLKAVSVDIQDPDRLGVASDPDRLVNVLTGHDSVISCFNPGHDLNVNPNLYRDVVEGTRTILDGVKRSGVRRFLYLGGAGSLIAPSGKMLVDDLEFFNSLISSPPHGAFVPEGPPILDIPRAARVALYMFELERELDWVFMSPSLYMGDFGGGSGHLRYGTDKLLLDADGRSARLDVEDLAAAIVEQIEEPRGVRVHLTVATDS